MFTGELTVCEALLFFLHVRDQSRVLGRGGADAVAVAAVVAVAVAAVVAVVAVVAAVVLGSPSGLVGRYR